LKRDKVVKIARLSSCKNVVSEREEFIFNAQKWSPVSCRSIAGQGKFASQRPTFYTTLYHASNQKEGL